MDSQQINAHLRSLLISESEHCITPFFSWPVNLRFERKNFRQYNCSTTELRKTQLLLLLLLPASFVSIFVHKQANTPSTSRLLGRATHQPFMTTDGMSESAHHSFRTPAGLASVSSQNGCASDQVSTPDLQDAKCRRQLQLDGYALPLEIAGKAEEVDGRQPASSGRSIVDADAQEPILLENPDRFCFLPIQ